MLNDRHGLIPFLARKRRGSRQDFAHLIAITADCDAESS